MVLDEIIAYKRKEIALRKRQTPLSEILKRASAWLPVHNLTAALRGKDVGLIAEIKRASPSKGRFAPELRADEAAEIYVRNGAAAISVLTDKRFFLGELGDLAAARRAVAGSGKPIPILRKDFILDPYQVAESRAFGADAVLLIVRALNNKELAGLSAEVAKWGMAALVEVYDVRDIERIAPLAPAIVGINHRNLSDFRTDLSSFGRLRRRLPGETIVVAASGVKTRADVARLAEQGANAVLVGEALVTAPDVGRKVRELVGRAAS